MAIVVFFVNDTKKQVVSFKKLYGDFEQKQGLLAYLSLCQGDTLRLEYEDSQWVLDFLYEDKHTEYRRLDIYKYNLGVNDDMISSKAFEALMNDVMLSH